MHISHNNQYLCRVDCDAVSSNETTEPILWRDLITDATYDGRRLNQTFHHHQLQAGMYN